jgi:OPT family oligopeptide transporter
MAIKQLSDEQIRTWTLEQKDRWWLENVWRGDMPQLTVRAAITGTFLGGILSLTNLYVGAKTGWGLGVGITSVILAFAAFKILSRIGLGSDFTVLENNCMQSIATSAGYMAGQLTTSLAAYMMITHRALPIGITIAWMIAISLLGVLYAFPLKRRFINDEQLPFPEGRAAGVVMDALHSGDAEKGLLQAKILTITAGLAALFKVGQSATIMEKLRLGFLAIPEFLDEWLYKLTVLRWRGIDLRELTVRPDTDFVLMAAGGLMGIRTGVSLMVGAIINYLLLAPWGITNGAVIGKVHEGVTHYGFRSITTWALWFGAAMMTTASLVAFFAKPQVLISSFRGIFRKDANAQKSDVLKDIELPLKVSTIGIPIVGGIVVLLAWWFFDVAPWLGIIAIPLIFLFTLIGVNSTALTAITPVSALGKLTQLTYGVLAPKNITANVITANITAEAALNASNLLMDIKPGYMLGAKPRQQAIGHAIGIVAGALASVPVFYAVFMRNGPDQLISDQYPYPSAIVWKSVSEVLTQGIGNLQTSSRVLALTGALIGIVLEIARLATKDRFWLSGIGIGLASIIPFNTCLAMFMGSLFFWLAARGFKNEESFGHRVFVKNLEPTCAGLIAGGALMGIVVIVLENFVL